MSPHPTLLSAVEQAFEATGRDGVAVPAMRRDVPEGDGIVEIYADLHAHGRPVPFDTLLPDKARFVPLPQYAWQHQRLWFRSSDVRPVAPESRRERPVGAGMPDEPLVSFDTIGELVRNTVADMLRMDSDRIDPNDGFFQLGMDSMLATRVRVRIESALGTKLPTTVMFEHATVNALTAYLTETVGGGMPAQPVEAGLPPSIVDDLPPVDDLSDEELLSQLAAELRTPVRTQGDVT
jgi:acyl carrier protein